MSRSVDARAGGLRPAAGCHLVRKQQGMSLVEATIILMVLMLLTSVLAPSIYDYVVDARDGKVKEDCEAIGGAIMRLVRDVGPCLKFSASGDCSPDNHVNVLYSDAPTDGWPQGAGFSDLLENQMVTNVPNYPRPGWRGGYLASPVTSDPWGTAYAVNVGYIAPETTDDCFVDTFCISAGPNRTFDTPYTGNGTGGVTRGGDDLVYVISGGTCEATGSGGNPGGGGTTTAGHTIGYWKNHPNAMPTPLDVWLGTPGGSSSVHVTTTTRAVTILTQHNRYGSPSNGIVKLYAQLLAALLNGGAGDGSISPTIAAANAFLATTPASAWSSLSSAAQSDVLGWQSALDAFNNSLDH